MSDLYVKNKDGSFVPIFIDRVFGEDLAGSLVVVRVGTDSHPASSSDIDEAEYVLSQAEVLNRVRDISLLITPHQIDIDTIRDKDIDDKSIYLQITSGEDIGVLEESVRMLYNKIRGKFKTVILPSPLKIADYKKAKEILKRSKIRRERRAGIRG